MNQKFKNYESQDNYQERPTNRMHFSIDEILQAERKPYRARWLKSLFAAFITVGAAFAATYTSVQMDIPFENAKYYLEPLCALGSIFGTKFLNDSFKFLVAKIKGVDEIQIEDLDPENPSQDYANKLQSIYRDKDNNLSDDGYYRIL